MVASKINSVRFSGIQAAVPTRISALDSEPGPIRPEDLEKVIKTVGVKRRRVLPDHQCASDMCVRAAETLLDNLGWNGNTIDVLIFVSQDSDYPLPVTAAVIQNRLGMSSQSACFDVPLGCSGFVYGAYLAALFLQNSTAKRALVLCGDTSMRHLKDDDTATYPIFGDAGTATALEFDEKASPMWFNVGTDGMGARHICVEAGGRRNSLVLPKDKYTDERWQLLYEQSRLHLNGSEVFTFTLKAVPGLVKETLEFSGLEKEEIDKFVFHQANAFMLKHLRKKLKISEADFVIDMEDYGNTSSASIPLAIASSLSEEVTQRKCRLLMAGFGVGWSWGSIIADVKLDALPEIVEIDEDYAVLGKP